MTGSGGFRQALDAFLASDEFEIIVRDDRSQLPVVPRALALHRDGAFTVYSRRDEAEASLDTLVLEIPLVGDEAKIREALLRGLPAHGQG